MVGFQKHNALSYNVLAAVKASHIVSYNIAKVKKPNTIGEKLVLMCGKDIVCLMIGTSAEKKLNTLSLSDNTMQCRISDMSDDIALQLDDSTNVASYAQVMCIILILRTNFCFALFHGK